MRISKLTTGDYGIEFSSEKHLTLSEAELKEWMLFDYSDEGGISAQEQIELHATRIHQLAQKDQTLLGLALNFLHYGKNVATPTLPAGAPTATPTEAQGQSNDISGLRSVLETVRARALDLEAYLQKMPTMVATIASARADLENFKSAALVLARDLKSLAGSETASNAHKFATPPSAKEQRKC